MVKCPGQDKAYWKPEDIYEIECPSCHEQVEFFKTDIIRKCSCGKMVVNEKLDLSCAEWCSAASVCIGLDYPLKNYKDGEEKKKDLKKLLDMVNEQEIKETVKRLYDINRLENTLLDIKQLYLIKLEDIVKYNKIVGYLKELMEEK